MGNHGAGTNAIERLQAKHSATYFNGWIRKVCAGANRLKLNRTLTAIIIITGSWVISQRLASTLHSVLCIDIANFRQRLETKAGDANTTVSYGCDEGI